MVFSEDWNFLLLIRTLFCLPLKGRYVFFMLRNRLFIRGSGTGAGFGCAFFEATVSADVGFLVLGAVLCFIGHYLLNARSKPPVVTTKCPSIARCPQARGPTGPLLFV